MGSAAADELIGRASQLSTDQIIGLATTTRRTIGRGLRGYLGLRSPALTTASLAAEAALKQVDLEDEMRTKVTALNEAVLSASMAAAEGQGPATQRVCVKRGSVFNRRWTQKAGKSVRRPFARRKRRFGEGSASSSRASGRWPALAPPGRCWPF